MHCRVEPAGRQPRWQRRGTRFQESGQDGRNRRVRPRRQPQQRLPQRVDEPCKRELRRGTAVLRSAGVSPAQSGRDGPRSGNAKGNPIWRPQWPSDRSVRQVRGQGLRRRSHSADRGGTATLHHSWPQEAIVGPQSDSVQWSPSTTVRALPSALARYIASSARRMMSCIRSDDVPRIAMPMLTVTGSRRPSTASGFCTLN